jgi:O-antigen/teichoic acid export membrane protein
MVNFVTQLKLFFQENKELGLGVFKNTAWLFSGQLFGKLLRVAIVVYAARVLGPASWGAFSYAMSLVAFLTIFTDVGVSGIVTRESAKDPSLSGRYFSTAFFIKLVLLIIGVAALILGAPYLTKIAEAKILFPIISLVLIFDSLRNFGFALSRAKEKMKWEGINEILTNVLITGFGFLFLLNSPTSFALTTAYAAATGIGFLAISWQLKNYFSDLFKHFNAQLIKPILSMAWPFALASSLGAIMINTDTILLGWLRSAEEVGFYSAAQRPVQLLYILPTLFAASLFPILTRLASQDKEKFKQVLENTLRITILTAAPITIGGIIFANPIINLLFGAAYQNAVPTFQILLLTVLIIFPSAIINNAIFAHNQQKNFIAFAALGALGNIIFDISLIPVWGIAGCALATVVTQLIANAFMWRKLKSITDFKIL